MAHKFCFPEHEKWAKTLVEKYCLPDGENGGLLGQCSIEDFKQIYTLGFKLKSDGLMTPVGEQWLKRLGSEPKVDPAFSSKGFLDFAEELGDRQLQAWIYYFELLKMKPENCALVNPVPSNDFTPTQMLRLYRGFCSLSSFWASSRLPPSPIEFGGENSNLTGHKSDCARKWKTVWKQGMPGDPERPMFDPLGALERFLDFPGDDIPMVVAVGYMGGICWIPSEKTCIITSLVLFSRRSLGRTFEGSKLSNRE